MSIKVCGLCKVKDSRYTCPRCNIPYCGLDCYKGDVHSSCSESFYRDCFVKEMKERKVSPEEQGELLKMIERVEEENPIQNFHLEEESPIEDRLKGLNVQDLQDKEINCLWEILTDSEKKDFYKAVEIGTIQDEGGKVLSEAWKPWWSNHKETLIEDSEQDNEVNALLPKIISVSPLSTLLPKGKPVSVYMSFNVVNVIYPYVLFQRLFNGCGTTDFHQDFSDSCVRSSDYLNKNRTFTSCDESISSAMMLSTEVCQANTISTSKRILIEAIQDVAHVLIGPKKDSVDKYLCSALSDLHMAFKQTRSALKSPAKDTSAKRKFLFSVLKKVEFLISWSHSAKQEFAAIAIEVVEIYKEKLLNLQLETEIEQKIGTPKCKEKPPKIEVLN